MGIDEEGTHKDLKAHAASTRAWPAMRPVPPSINTGTTKPNSAMSRGKFGQLPLRMRTRIVWIWLEGLWGQVFNRERAGAWSVIRWSSGQLSCSRASS